jgi:hypothetical protein
MQGHEEPSAAERRGEKGSALLHLMRARPVARWLVGVPPVLVGLFALNLAPWRCPLLATTGCRCPGCGLTRALGALARGEWSVSLALHPFALVLAAAWGVLALHLLLGPRGRHRIEAFVGRVERAGALGRWPLSTWLAGGLLLFGVARLARDALDALGVG